MTYVNVQLRLAGRKSSMGIGGRAQDALENVFARALIWFLFCRAMNRTALGSLRRLYVGNPGVEQTEIVPHTIPEAVLHES